MGLGQKQLPVCGAPGRPESMLGTQAKVTDDRP